jgi:hypothetical protein
VGRSAFIRVVRNRELQLKEVGISSGVDVSGVPLAVDVALALRIIFVLEAARALELRVGCCEANFEAVVAARDAAENELVDLGKRSLEWSTLTDTQAATDVCEV